MTDERNVEMISPAAYVIGKIGGLTKTANKLGLAVSTVQGWKNRKRIPQDHWAPCIAAAEANGVTLSLADFLKEHEAPKEAEAAA